MIILEEYLRSYMTAGSERDTYGGRRNGKEI